MLMSFHDSVFAFLLIHTLPFSEEQSIQPTCMLPWLSPGIICTRWKLLAKITKSHPEAYAYMKTNKKLIVNLNALKTKPAFEFKGKKNSFFFNVHIYNLETLWYSKSHATCKLENDMITGENKILKWTSVCFRTCGRNIAGVNTFVFICKYLCIVQ